MKQTIRCAGCGDKERFSSGGQFGAYWFCYGCKDDLSDVINAILDAGVLQGDILIETELNTVKVTTQ